MEKSRSANLIIRKIDKQLKNFGTNYQTCLLFL